MRTILRWLGLVLLLLSGISLFYTYPLIFNLARLFPGFNHQDTCLAIWNIWHLKQTVLAHNFFDFNTAYIFYPQNPSLILHNYTITSGLMSLPLQLFFPPIVSANIIFLSQFVLTGMGMAFLVYYLTRSKIAATWAAVTLAFCPYVITQSCYFLHFSTIWSLPWGIYLILRFLEKGSLKFGLLTALVYALCLLEDQTYFFMLSVIGVLVFTTKIATKPASFNKKLLLNTAIGLTVFCLISGTYLIKLLTASLSQRQEFPVWPDISIAYFSLHLQDILRPSPLVSLYKLIPCLPQPMMLSNSVFAGYIPLLLAAYALLNIRKMTPPKRAEITFCLAAAGLFFLLALGPAPLGEANPWNKLFPYNYLCSGILRQFRIPVRFSLITLLGIYIIAGFAVERLVKSNKHKLINNISIGSVLILLQIIEFMPVPYPLLELNVPPAYQELAYRDKDSAVLVLPLGWQSSYRSLGNYQRTIQFYQTIHQHPIFQGQIARINNDFFDYYQKQPGFQYLMHADKKLPTQQDQEAVYVLLEKYGIKNVIIHSAYFDQPHLQALQTIFINNKKAAKIRCIILAAWQR